MVRSGGISGEPDIVTVIDIDTVLAGWPDTTCPRLALAAQEAGIRWPSPSTQKLARCIEFQNRRRRFAAVRDRTIGARLAQSVDWLCLGVGCAWHGVFQTGLFVGHGARAVVDPNVIVPVDVQTADLPQKPVVRQGLRPR